MNTKFNLYKREWLDLVFTDRNRSYGAYDLRMHYGANMMRAMAITLAGFVSFGVLVKVFNPPQDQNRYISKVYDGQPRPLVLTPPKKTEVVHESVVRHASTSKPLVHIATQQLSVPKVTNDPVPEEHFTPQALIANPGLTTTPGDGQLQTTIVDSEPGTSSGTPGDNGTANVDNSVHLGVDEMPEPVGGLAAWSRFLQRNIRYPDTDSEGRVYLSFIVEKDGRLSNITLEKGVTTLLDEEAMRVLKMAPAWRPGKQNGQAVRVKYTLPIVFQVSQ